MLVHHQIARPPFARSAMNSLVRIASARIVHVQFLSGCDDERPAVGDEDVAASRAPGSSC